MESLAMPAKQAKEIIKALRENHVFDEHDLGNLEFLLTASFEVLQDWANYVDDDDMDYARELLLAARQYWSEMAEELDTTQANQVLKKFML